MITPSTESITQVAGISFLVGTVLMLIGFVNRNLRFDPDRNGGIPLWLFGIVIIAASVLLVVFFIPSAVYSDVVLSLTGKVVVGIVSSLIVAIIISLVKRR